MPFRQQYKFTIAALFVLMSLVQISCANQSINSLMTFDLYDSFAVPLTSSISPGTDTQWTFTVNVGPQLDTSKSTPSLVYSAKVSRIQIYSDTTYHLSNLQSAKLYVSSSSVKDTLVGQVASFAGTTVKADILPNMTQIAQQLRDSILTFTLHITFKTLPAAADTLTCQPTISVIAQPQ